MITDAEALRVTGHLLEHHGVQGSWCTVVHAFQKGATVVGLGYSREYVLEPRAHCWCLVGALELVGVALQKRDRKDLGLVRTAIDRLGLRMVLDLAHPRVGRVDDDMRLVTWWDDLTRRQRNGAIRRLQRTP